MGWPYPAGHSDVLISSHSSCSQDDSPESSASEEALSGKLLDTVDYSIVKITETKATNSY